MLSYALLEEIGSLVCRKLNFHIKFLTGLWAWLCLINTVMNENWDTCSIVDFSNVYCYLLYGSHILVIAAQVSTEDMLKKLNSSEIVFPPPNTLPQRLCSGRIPSMIIQTESIVRQINTTGECLVVFINCTTLWTLISFSLFLWTLQTEAKANLSHQFDLFVTKTCANSGKCF